MVGMGQVVGMQKVPVVQMVGFVISQTSVKELSVSSRNQEYHWLESKLPGHFSLSFPLWKTLPSYPIFMLVCACLPLTYRNILPGSER